MEQKLAAFAVRNDERRIAGTVSVGDGETFDVGAALKGNGTIVVLKGSRLDHALRSYPALEGTEVPSGAVAVNADDDGVKASGPARSKAAELGVDLNEVEGTGSGGAIKVSDVEAAVDTAGDDDAQADEGEGS